MEELLDILTLREVGTATIKVEGLDEDDSEAIGTSLAQIFVGQSQQQPHGRTFGGQVLAQGLMAAGATVQDTMPHRVPHSLHAYFMRPGDASQPIRFSVERMRDGHSFSTRRVHAMQKGQPILAMTASFQDPAGGLDHQDPMPDVPRPEELTSLADAFAGIDHPTVDHIRRRAIEHRHVEGHLMDRTGPQQSHQSVWMRPVGKVPNDPLLKAAILAYASDFTLLESSLRQHGINWSDRRLRPASLDHAMWFHREAEPDQWLLYVQESPSAQGGRGLGIGRIFTEDGVLIATVAQEGMLRIKE